MKRPAKKGLQAVRLESDQIAWLKKQTEETGVPASFTIRKALAEYIAKIDKK